MEGRHRVSPGPYAAFRALNAPGEVPAALDCDPASESALPVPMIGIEGGWHLSRCFERPKRGGRSGGDPVRTLRISAPQDQRVPSGPCDP